MVAFKACRAFTRAYFTIRLCDTWIGRKVDGVLFYCAAVPASFAMAGLALDRLGYVPGNAIPLWVGSAIIVLRSLPRVLGFALAPVQKLWRSIRIGLGGSSRFAGMLQEWRTLYRRGAIYLGPSLYGWWRVGHKDDRMVVTIASIGAGKGRCAIIPNVLRWRGPLLMVDPKGTNSTVTARALHRLAHMQESVRLRILNFLIAAPLRFMLSFWPRAVDWDPFFDRLPPRVGIIDPFYEVKGPAQRFRTAVNPLGRLDPDSPELAEELDDIAGALIKPSSEKEPTWDAGGRLITRGCLGCLLSGHGKGNFTLIDLRDLVLKDQDDLLETLLSEAEKGGRLARLIRGGAAPLMTGSKEAAAYLEVARKNTAWLDSEAMAHVLQETGEGGLERLKSGTYSLSLVLPPHMLDVHAQFLRLFITAAVREMIRPPRAKHTVLFCLDEFYALGKLPLQSAAALGRSYKIKLYLILQNLGQLLELYGEQNFEGFTSAAGCVQIFGVNDKRGEEYIRDRIGHHIVDGAIRNLREPEEVQRQTGREEGLQIVLRSGQDPLLLSKSYYDKMFWRGSYDYDPDFVSPKYYPAEEKPLMTRRDVGGEGAWDDWDDLSPEDDRPATA
jgi:type IV secretion system protein VirD4